jgi:transcriptional regulator with XRE-family HTH domain
MNSPVVSPVSRDELTLLRRECGLWLKEKREAAGLSQRGIAQKVGIEFYTFISQIESGRGRVPPERYEAYAEAVNVDPKEFTKTMLRYNEPLIYGLLYPEEPKVRPEAPKSRDDQATVTDLEKRILLLEQMLFNK